MPTDWDTDQLDIARQNAILYNRYESTGSVDDANKFKEALRALQILLPAAIDRAGVESVRFELARYEKLEEKVDEWLEVEKIRNGRARRYLRTNCNGVF